MVQESSLEPAADNKMDEYSESSNHPHALKGWEKRVLGRRRGGLCDVDGSLQVLLRLVASRH